MDKNNNKFDKTQVPVEDRVDKKFYKQPKINLEIF